jgi:hypothetical protein
LADPFCDWPAGRSAAVVRGDDPAATDKTMPKCQKCGFDSEAAKEAIEAMAIQFGYLVSGPKITTGGLSALEQAFDVLGWDDPHPVPEMGCDEPGCREPATCGFPDGEHYRRTCGKHYHYQRPWKPDAR